MGSASSQVKAVDPVDPSVTRSINNTTNLANFDTQDKFESDSQILGAGSEDDKVNDVAMLSSSHSSQEELTGGSRVAETAEISGQRSSEEEQEDEGLPDLETLQQELAALQKQTLRKPEVIEVPSDEALLELVEREHPMLEGFKLSAAKVLNCSVSVFFDTFFKNDASLPFDQF